MKTATKVFVWFFVIWLTWELTGFGVWSVMAQGGSLTYGDSEMPVILPRLTWDNGPSLNALLTWLPQTENGDLPPDWQSVERIIIHDTGCDPATNPTCNNNTDPVATIQAIYRYHAVTRGWGDIGYNYIIDQQGRIYEGRFGGNGSRGAHTYYDRQKDNFNFGSIGIALLGNYSSKQPPEVVYQSLNRLVAWLCALNGLNPQGQSASYIWNASKGGFKSYFSGPTVLGHKDVEGGNPDPGLLNFNRLRQEAASLTVKFRDYIYQKDSGAKIYKITNGVRQTFDDITKFLAAGYSYIKLVNLPAAQLDLFSETRFLKYPDGSLLQIKEEPTIYLIEGGKKRGLSMTEKQFLALGFEAGKIKQATADELINYPAGPLIRYGPDGQLISDGAKVYLVQGGKLHWVTSQNLFSVLGYKWSKVKSLAPEEVYVYLEGSALIYPDGALLRAKDEATIYLIKDGQKHEFVSAQSFLRLGYKWANVIAIDSFEVALCPTGGIVFYADKTLIRAEGDSRVFLIEKGQVRQFLTAEIFLGWKHSWSKILIVIEAELARYAQGKPVSYPDGWLVRPGNENNVYLISAGQPQHIDGATFKKRGYKWSKVLVVEPQEFNILYRGASIPVSVPSSTPSPTSTPNPTPTPAPLVASSPTPSPSLSPTPTVTPLATHPKIRIAIFEVKNSSVTLTANSAYDVLDKAGQIVASKIAGEKFVYSFASPSEAFAKIVPRDQGAIVQIVSYEDRPAWKPTLNYNEFRGAVEIVYSAKVGRVWVVNELYLEDYLRGIGEILQDDPAEHQKTMIVAARTYAYSYILKGGKYGSDEVYHLINTSADQLYKGYAREAVAPAIVAAVEATTGEAALFNGQPIVAAYSSGAPELATNGTKSACLVWGGNYCQAGYEYLAGGVKDPAGAPYTQTACGGANHCVGVSAAGSRQFARSGAKNHQEILPYYYPGITILKIY